MQGIPKTYKFKKCDFNEFSNILKSKNAELYNGLIGSISDCRPKLEIKNGAKILIYKNNQIIGYLGFISYKKMIEDLLNYYNAYIKKHSKQIKYKIEELDSVNVDEFLNSLEPDIKIINTNALTLLIALRRIVRINEMFKPSHNKLYITALEIFDEFRTFNTIKVVFNYIKDICTKNQYDCAVCHAKNQKIARVYKMGGFQYVYPFSGDDYDIINQNPPMFLIVDDKDYYDVTEKLKNKYKNKLYQGVIMKRTNKKALYESIMTSVAREVKKVLNEEYNEELKINYEIIGDYNGGWAVVKTGQQNIKYNLVNKAGKFIWNKPVEKWFDQTSGFSKTSPEAGCWVKIENRWNTFKTDGSLLLNEWGKLPK